MGHLIFNLHLGVGPLTLCEKEGVGHVFFIYHISKCSDRPPQPYTSLPVPYQIAPTLGMKGPLPKEQLVKAPSRFSIKPKQNEDK